MKAAHTALSGDNLLVLIKELLLYFWRAILLNKFSFDKTNVFGN